MTTAKTRRTVTEVYGVVFALAVIAGVWRGCAWVSDVDAEAERAGAAARSGK